MLTLPIAAKNGYCLMPPMRPPMGTMAPTGWSIVLKVPLDWRLDLDDGLVGLDFGDQLAFLYRVADRLEPFDHGAFADREIAERHASPACRRSCAADDRCGLASRNRLGRGRCDLAGSSTFQTDTIPMIRHRGLAGDDVAHALDDARCIDQHGALQNWREWMRGRRGVQPARRRIELVESKFVDRLRDLAADAAHRPGFIDHQQAMRLPARLATVSTSSGMMVRGSMISASIPSAASASAASSAALHHLASRDDGDVATGARDPRDAEWHECSPAGTSPLEANSALVSSMMTGRRPGVPSSSAPWRRPASTARRR